MEGAFKPNIIGEKNWLFFCNAKDGNEFYKHVILTGKWLAKILFLIFPIVQKYVHKVCNSDHVKT